MIAFGAGQVMTGVGGLCTNLTVSRRLLDDEIPALLLAVSVMRRGPSGALVKSKLISAPAPSGPSTSLDQCRAAPESAPSLTSAAFPEKASGLKGTTTLVLLSEGEVIRTSGARL